MDLLIRYWCCMFNQVKTRYWISEFLGHISHLNLLDNFMKGLFGVDWEFYETLTKHCSDCEIPRLINIRKCSLHIINRDFQRCARESSRGISKCSSLLLDGLKTNLLLNVSFKFGLVSRKL